MMEPHVTPRTRWPDLPTRVHRHVAEVLEGEVIEAVTQSKGFSPGSADRVRTSRSRRAFVKAVSRTRNADSYELHRREIAVMKALTPSVRAPRLLGSFEDDEWAALILEDIDGRRPGPTSTEADVLAVLASLETLPRMRNAVNTAALPEASQELAPVALGWTRIREDEAAAVLPRWAQDRMGELDALAAHASAAVRGDHLVHLDFRTDNVLIDGANHAWIIDWPWAGIGARWLDALTFLIDARLHGIELDFDRILCAHELFAEATFDDINAVLAALTGYFFDSARRPAPRNMPTLRSFQRSEAQAGLGWLQTRLG